MIKIAMDSLHLDFVKCSSSGSHKGLYFFEEVWSESVVGVYFSKVTAIAVIRWSLLGSYVCFTTTSLDPVIPVRVLRLFHNN